MDKQISYMTLIGVHEMHTCMYVRSTMNVCVGGSSVYRLVEVNI